MTFTEKQKLTDLSKTGLDLLREPFPPHQIGKLPKPTAAQTEEVKKNFKAGIRCTICGLWHHPKVVHLDYVGHAALTDRLLDADPHWNWEPLTMDEQGLPLFDKTGGLWIKLTVFGVTRMGYGNAASSTFKEVGSREKEVIGDALRNAAMRFGAALDLWHKGDLHDNSETVEPPKTTKKELTEEDKINKELFKVKAHDFKVQTAITEFMKTSDNFKNIKQWDASIKKIETNRKNKNRVALDPKFYDAVIKRYDQVLATGVEEVEPKGEK